MVKHVIAQAAEHENSGAWVGHRILNNLHQEFPEAFGYQPPPFIGINEILAAENLRTIAG
jgi:hypothetical protein